MSLNSTDMGLDYLFAADSVNLSSFAINSVK